MKKFICAAAVVAAAMSAQSAPAFAQNVIITPLGSHDGEFCRNDRALLFEDPSGDTLLYDPGRTVRGGTDPRLPETLDVLLLTSVHSDHLGDVRPTGANAGTCASPATTNANLPESTVDSVLSEHPETRAWVGGEMSGFLGARHPGQAATLRPGGTRTTTGGVKVSVVPAFHSNGLDPAFLAASDLKSDLEDEGLTAYVGPDHGYVIRFTNGLVVYLTADTGPHSDMATIVRDFYGANLAVVHLGGTFGMGPEEGAFAVNALIKPKAAIVTHVNEAATDGGVVQPGTTTEKFLSLLNKQTKGFAPLSGVPISCDGKGKCTQ